MVYGSYSHQLPEYQLVSSVFWKLYYIHTLASTTEECGIVAQVSAPLAQAEISMYYICTYCNDHTLVSQLVSVSNFCGSASK